MPQLWDVLHTDTRIIPDAVRDTLAPNIGAPSRARVAASGGDGEGAAGGEPGITPRRPRPPKRGIAGVGEVLEKSLTTALKSASAGGDASAPPPWLAALMERDQQTMHAMFGMFTAGLMMVAGNTDAGMAMLQSTQRAFFAPPAQPSVGNAGTRGSAGAAAEAAEYSRREGASEEGDSQEE